MDLSYRPMLGVTAKMASKLGEVDHGILEQPMLSGTCVLDAGMDRRL